MPLTISEAQGLDMGIAIQGPGKAGGRILPAGEQHEGSVWGAFDHPHVMPYFTRRRRVPILPT